MRSFKIEIKGNPCLQKRHRTTRTGHTYDPSSPDKADVIALMHLQAPKKPFKRAISVNLLFYMPRPKSHYRTGKFSNDLKPHAPVWHTTRTGDIDNLAKFYLDCMSNNVVMNDDCQVCVLTSKKIYSDSPKTVITVKEIDEC
tara:strand:- start:33 stop:458 length:426 start_codon:yes stop_codon:yes gene_type:complete